MGVLSAEAIEHQGSVANKEFGFWLYLMTDLILFSALFATYVVLAQGHAAGGPTGRELFDLPYTFGETLFLLSSSTSCGMAMLAMHVGRKGRVLGWLIITFLLGLGFIGMEVNEFHHMITDGNGPTRSAYLSAFFTLVGTHGTHVCFGLLWMVVMTAQVIVKGLTLPVRSRLMRLSMFWHFLDIVWVGVFTVVYLLGSM
ncbi:MAG: cytochrome o ubiquinol oxidase subunit III [Deltaproteobacteria bacterium]